MVREVALLTRQTENDKKRIKGELKMKEISKREYDSLVKTKPNMVKRTKHKYYKITEEFQVDEFGNKISYDANGHFYFY